MVSEVITPIPLLITSLRAHLVDFQEFEAQLLNFRTSPQNPTQAAPGPNPVVDVFIYTTIGLNVSRDAYLETHVSIRYRYNKYI